MKTVIVIARVKGDSTSKVLLKAENISTKLKCWHDKIVLLNIAYRFHKNKYCLYEFIFYK